MSRIAHPMIRAISLSLILFLTLMAAPRISSSVAAAGVRYTAATAQGSGNCSSWSNACTLQTALTGAVSGDQVWVRAGVHKPTANPADRAARFALKSGVAVYGGFQGAKTSLGQRNWQVNRTVLSGDIDNNDSDPNGDGVIENVADIVGANSYHVVLSSFTNNTAVLNGFTITAGQANGSAFPAQEGGGFLGLTASPTLSNLLFSGNMATAVGGGLYSRANTLSFVLTDITFRGNSATEGGGMGAVAGSYPLLRNVVFVDNTAARGAGMLNDASNPVLRGGTFINNRASGDGGGIVNVGASPVMNNVAFSGNSAVNTGGGIVNRSSALPTLANVILWANNATQGPQISNQSGASAAISYSNIQGCGGSANWNTACGTNGPGNVDVNPLFVDADGPDNIVGTSDDNLRLQVTSPVIDAGWNQVVAAVTTDRDGNPRFVDIPTVPNTGNGTPPIVDMGAYEAQLPPGYKVFLPAVLRGP